MAREPVYLCGDEDGGATLWCWDCGVDADPVAYYSGFCNTNPYATDDVPSVDNLHELATLAAKHVATHEPDDPAPTNTHTLTGGQVLQGVHPPTACVGRGCPLHHPTPHHMVEWGLLWRGDRGLMERLCPTHGTGHPDPDHMAWYATTHTPNDTWAEGVHGCCGCCLPPLPEAA